MKHQCPKCQREYNAELNFCPQCGEPSKASLKNSSKEQTGKHEAASASSVSNVTTHMDEFFNSNPRRVEPLPETESGVPTVDAPINEETVKDPELAKNAKRRAKEVTTGQPPSPVVLAGDAGYYRSFRMLSMAVIIGNGLTALSVIGLALIFTFSQQRLWNMSQERLMVVIQKEMAVNETLMAKLEQANARAEQSNARLQESGAEFAELKQEVASLKQKNATTEDILRAMKEDQVAEQRIVNLPANLTKRQSSAVARNITLISARIKNPRDKRALEAIKQRVVNKEDRAVIYREYAQVLPNLDKQVRDAMEAKVGKTLLGE